MRDESQQREPLDEVELVQRILTQPADRRKRSGTHASPSLASGPEAHSFVGAIRLRLEEAQDDLEEGESLSVLTWLPSGERVQVNRISARPPELVVLECTDASGDTFDLLAHEQGIQLVVRRTRSTRADSGWPALVVEGDTD